MSGLKMTKNTNETRALSHEHNSTSRSANSSGETCRHLKKPGSTNRIATASQKDRPTAIGSIVLRSKIRTCSSGDMLAGRHRQTHSLQYSAAVPGRSNKPCRKLRLADANLEVWIYANVCCRLRDRRLRFPVAFFNFPFFPLF